MLLPCFTTMGEIENSEIKSAKLIESQGKRMNVLIKTSLHIYQNNLILRDSFS